MTSATRLSEGRIPVSSKVYQRTYRTTEDFIDVLQHADLRWRCIQADLVALERGKTETSSLMAEGGMANVPKESWRLEDQSPGGFSGTSTPQ